ncbi:molybdopterin oxidoreductase family protein [Microbacterium halophytorum]|uniref:molybdopterin oxidoreductase family protein n=1 Tax=Microbacterium halophytorum TaxID=2067568 RepID=UPI000CFCBB4B|nr:molybdopterin oxidoreductase family protein [Microbacterium halophytorum]
MTAADTHCPYCALQCAMTLTPAGDGAEVAGRDFPTNRGGLCRKGWTSAELLRRPDRLTAPLIRNDAGELAEATWEAALDLIAERVRGIQEESGPDAVGIFGGGGLTNEKAYQLGKFARVGLGTSRIDYNGRFCMSSAAAASNRAFGLDRGLPFPLADLDTAEAILMLGSNVGDTMPPFVQHLQGARGRGGLIVVDPRRSTTAKLTADGAGVHAQAVPGADMALLLGIAHVVIAENLHDREYLAERTAGFEAVKRSVAPWWPERTAQATGVPAQVIRDIARRMAAARSAYVLTGRGVEQHADGTDTATAAINLALLLGLPGRPGSGYGTLTGQGNGQGGREHGQKCDQLPGYRKIVDPAARAHVAGVWGVSPEDIPGPGVPAVELLESAGRPGGVRMLMVHGSNPAISGPDVARVREALGRLELLVVSDFFRSETAELADVVLPVLQWAEEEGTMTNLEGRIIRRRRAVAAPEGARSELWMMRELAQRLDAPGEWSLDPAEVFDELGRASAGGISDYSGISHELLDAGAEAYWPYPAGSSGTPRVFLDRFAHEDGRARMVAVRPSAGDAASGRPVRRRGGASGERGRAGASPGGAEARTEAGEGARANPDPERREAPGRAVPRGGELHLVTGRLLGQYQSGTQTRRVPELAATDAGLTAQLHPSAAADRGIADGARVRVRNHRGEVEATAKLSSDIRYDTVFLPFHFPGGESANLLTPAETDPMSAMPEFKHAVVDVVPA